MSTIAVVTRPTKDYQSLLVRSLSGVAMGGWEQTVQGDYCNAHVACHIWQFSYLVHSASILGDPNTLPYLPSVLTDKNKQTTNTW